MRFRTVLITLIAFSFITSQAGFSQFKIGKGALGGGKNKTNVNDVLKRVKQVKKDFQGATNCLSQGRDIIFDISATSEKKRQLREKEAELAAAENAKDKERITIEIEEMKDEEIQRAQKSGEMEERRLSKEQAKSVGRLSFNITLAIMLDRRAVKNAPKIQKDAKKAIDNAKSNTFEWLRIASKAKELTNAISVDIPQILKEAPHQIETLGALLESCSSLSKNNEIEKHKAPKEDSEFLEIEYTPTEPEPVIVAEGDAAECHFTSFFIGNSSDFDPAFIKMSESGDFSYEAGEWVQTAFEEIPQLNFVPLDIMADIETTDKINPKALFIRGLISRADIKKVEKFSLDEYAFSATATLEFFDLASGEVFYTRTMTGQVFTERAKGTNVTEEEKAGYFKTCLKGTIEEVAKVIAGDYLPGMLEGHIAAVIDQHYALDIGRQQGVYQGMTFYLYDRLDQPPVGMLKAGNPQDKICPANPVFINENAKPDRGWTVRSFGVNKLNQQKGQVRYMVSDFTPALPEELPEEFDIDPQSMGQWLHDGLSKNSDLFLLAPLLAKLDSSGKVNLQNSLFDAQLKYSIFGGLTSDAATGNRAFPDIFIKGIISHAGVQTYIIPGAENKILEVGVSIEFYDRKTRDFLFSTQHSGYKTEKIVTDGDKIYRALELEASFRDLAKLVIRQASMKAAKYYNPIQLAGNIIDAGDGKTFTVEFNDNGAGTGDLFNLMTPVNEIKGLDGTVLGAIEKNYGIARITGSKGEKNFTADVLVSDGSTPVKPGDKLSANGKSASGTTAGKLCQVIGFEVKGSVNEKYDYSLGKMTEWLHEALLSSGQYRLMPPNFRETQMGMAEVGLSLGQFEVQDEGEIIYQGFRRPEIIITGELLSAVGDKKTGEFKDVITLKSDIGISISTPTGEIVYSQHKTGTSKLELQKSRGKTVVGATDISPEFDELTRKTIDELVEVVKKEYKP